MSERPWHERYVDRFYRSQPGWVDGTQAFHQLVQQHIPKGSRILEVGSGPDNPSSEFLASLGELHGIDPDPDVKTNRFLKSAEVLGAGAYPYDDASFDVCVSNYVVEHVEDPHNHLREIHRILKESGVYIFRTPNKYHYVSLVAAYTPHAFHRLVANRLRALPHEAHDPYPTVYGLNTVGSIQGLGDEVGFDIESLQMIEKEPSYGKFSRALFVAFMTYERVVNASDRLQSLRANIFAVLRKR